MTNGDRIRAMTNEELVKILAVDMNFACYHCDRSVSFGGNLDCSKCRREDMSSILLEYLAKEYVPRSDAGDEENDKR